MSILLARRGILRQASPPVFPLDIPGSPIVYWAYEADRLSGTDDSAVASWSDMSAAGRTLSQATSTSQPTLQTAELNGLQVVRFDGADSLTGSGWTLNQPFTVFFVVKSALVDATPRNIISQASGPTVLIRKHSNNFLQAFAGTVLADDVMTTSWAMGFAIFNGATSSVALNGATVTTGNAGTSAMTGLTMGSAWNGDIYALISFEGIGSTAQINHLGNGYATKTGLTWNAI